MHQNLGYHEWRKWLLVSTIQCLRRWILATEADKAKIIRVSQVVGNYGLTASYTGNKKHLLYYIHMNHLGTISRYVKYSVSVFLRW